MGFNRTPPTDPPPAYRYVTRYYGRSLRPIVIAMSLITAIWALAWTVLSFRSLRLADNDDLPKLAALSIAQGVMFAVACGFQTFGIVAAVMQRLAMIRIYAFLCALSTLLVFGLSIMRVVTHFVFKSDLISECTAIAQTGTIGAVFGIWGSSPASGMDETEAAQYCSNEWNTDTRGEIVSLIILTLLGLLFTSTTFAYYRQILDPASPANSSRLPSNQARRDGYPTQYNPPYDGSAYVPVYLPPPGPPPIDADTKPPEYRHTSYTLAGEDKDTKADDPFSDYSGPSVPMPTHWVEDRDTTLSSRV